MPWFRPAKFLACYRRLALHDRSYRNTTDFPSLSMTNDEILAVSRQGLTA